MLYDLFSAGVGHSFCVVFLLIIGHVIIVLILLIVGMGSRLSSNEPHTNVSSANQFVLSWIGIR